jgi:hypothetical protein
MSSSPDFGEVHRSREADQLLPDGRQDQNQSRRQQASHKTIR